MDLRSTSFFRPASQYVILDEKASLREAKAHSGDKKIDQILAVIQ